MYIMYRRLLLLRTFFSFFFLGLGLLLGQNGFRYDTSSCRVGFTDSIHPWHGDHRATQEQNHTLLVTPVSLYDPFRTGAEVRKQQALELERGEGDERQGVTW